MKKLLLSFLLVTPVVGISLQAQALTCQSVLTDWAELKSAVEIQLGTGESIEMDLLQGLEIRDLPLSIEFQASDEDEIRFLEDLEIIEERFGRILSDKELAGIYIAHIVGDGEIGKNGRDAELRNYTLGQIKRKREVLKLYGYSKDEARFLIDQGYVGKTTKNRYKRIVQNGVEEWILIEGTESDSNQLGPDGVPRHAVRRSVKKEDVPSGWSRFWGTHE